MNSPTHLPRTTGTIPSITIQLLGDFSVCYDRQPLTTINTPRLQALLAYLLLHRQAPQSRRRLAFLFWPDSTEAQALTNLRKQLLYLRQVLPDSDALLHMDRQSVQWDATASVQIDVEAFRSALAAAAHAPDSQAISGLRRALALYTGELLPGCYEEWLLPLREALHTQRNHALERLSGLLEEQRQYAEAIVYAQQLLRDDPLHEATYRRLIRLLALTGERATALRLYHTCVTQLREELGVDPDGETQAVYERLLQGTPAGSTHPELAAYAPFVGRQGEWQILQQRWRIALRGQPQFVLIAGEAGIGKTRLAEELLNWAAHQGFCTVRARCYAAEGRLTYAPIIEWLRAEPLHGQHNKVAATWLTELARLLPELLTEQPTVPPPAPINQSWQRTHLFEAVTRTLLALNRPLVLLLDDLQWCDKETLELLHFLLRHAPTFTQSPLLLVGTARLPDEVDATHPLAELLNALHGNDTLTQLDLARLTAAETGELACQMVEHTLDERTLQQLFIDTAGNPLFVVETLRATQGQIGRNGKVESTIGATTLPIAASEALVQHLPPKVLAVIQARLGQLSAVARELCEWAAIIGRAFTLDLLTEASQIPHNKAVNALDELWQRRIIREQGQDAYDFSHDRIRDVAGAGISRVRYRHLHRCVAEALESQSTAQVGGVAAQVATHYDAAGLAAKAVDYYQQAANGALYIYAQQEAIAYLKRALELLHMQPPSRQHTERAYQLSLCLVPPMMIVYGYGSAELRERCIATRALAEELNYPPDPAILCILAIHYLAHRQWEATYAFGMEMLQGTQGDQQPLDPFLYVEGCYTLGVTTFWQGDFPQSLLHLERAINAYNPQYHTNYIIQYGQDPGVVCLSRLAWTLWYLGYAEQAEQRIQQALSLAEQLKHPFSTSYVLLFMEWLAYDMQDKAMRTTVVELQKRYQAQFDLPPSFYALVPVCYGNQLVGGGQVSEGIAYIRSGIAAAAESKYDLMFGLHFRAILAQALMVSRDFTAAAQAIDAALTQIEQYNDRYYEAELHRLRGELLLASGQPFAVVEQCFLQALAVARHQSAKSLELRAAVSLGRMRAQQGKQGEAYMLLAEIYGWFTEGFDTPDLQEAKALLAQLQRSRT